MWNTILAKKTWKGTLKNIDKNGKAYIVNTTIFPIINDKEEIVEFISIRHDITELIQLRDKFKEMSIKDSLTGLYNRGYFHEVFLSEHIKVKEKKNSCCFLILFDIDDFKQINDQYGHDCGDKVLITFANRVKEVIREKDIFCRVGGDEFAILVSDTSIEKAKYITEKIKKALKTFSFENGITLTLSVGITDCNPNDCLEEIYKRADIALYRAKEKGKNCIEIN
jgi:diguanylate cyclase